MLFRPNLQTFSAAFSLLAMAGCSVLNRVESLKLADDVPGLEPQATPGQSTLPDAALPRLLPATTDLRFLREPMFQCAIQVADHSFLLKDCSLIPGSLVCKQMPRC